MKTLLTILWLSTMSVCNAQTTAGKLSFALPDHAGRLSLDQGGFKITELSVKSNGGEFGIRAEDGSLHLLGFLFVVPENPKLTAATCREAMLQHEDAATQAAAKDRSAMKSATGVEIALVTMAAPNGGPTAVRAFVASGNLCGDLKFSVAQQAMPMQKVKSILDTLTFDPQAKPTFRDAFEYATVAFDHDDLAGAAHAYRSALALVDGSDEPLKWRRVTTDQLAMALGMQGDLSTSRAVNYAAIRRDPDYPIYYYSLACADGEEGNAADAKAHLQQAFDRRANVLPGETMPDPATDDSFRQLMDDPAFAEFVKTLTASPAKPPSP
jgi:hypothetical protein